MICFNYIVKLMVDYHHFVIKRDHPLSGWMGRIWDETNHNPDRIVMRDRRSYGVEI